MLKIRARSCVLEGFTAEAGRLIVFMFTIRTGSKVIYKRRLIMADRELLNKLSGEILDACNVFIEK